MTARPHITIGRTAIDPEIYTQGWYALGRRTGGPWRAYRMSRYRQDAELAFLNLTGASDYRALVLLTGLGEVIVHRYADDSTPPSTHNHRPATAGDHHQGAHHHGRIN